MCASAGTDCPMLPQRKLGDGKIKKIRHDCKQLGHISPEKRKMARISRFATLRFGFLVFNPESEVGAAIGESKVVFDIQDSGMECV